MQISTVYKYKYNTLEASKKDGERAYAARRVSAMIVNYAAT